MRTRRRGGKRVTRGRVMESKDLMTTTRERVIVDPNSMGKEGDDAMAASGTGVELVVTRTEVDLNCGGVEDDAVEVTRPRPYPPRRPGVSATRSWPPMCGPRREDGAPGGGWFRAKPITGMLFSEEEEEEEPEEVAEDGVEVGDG
ncbi:unnamed protein product [Linum trigynum]|uniref:Uncharacterized protein n=1 Tax=Linum trigynum TaxID=586398 RepID=A0AAV2E0S4_9ROSI